MCIFLNIEKMRARNMKARVLVDIFGRRFKTFIFICVLFNLFSVSVTAKAKARAFRQAPICVDQENKTPYEVGLARFTWIFEFYKTYNSYVPVSDGKTSPSGLISRFDLNAIKIDDPNSGYQDTLRNWVHIDIESEVELEGLYVQAISSPWGIPFGEFIADFDCKDCIGSKTSDYLDEIHIIPCSQRAALSWTHPNVFTIGGDPIEVSKGEKRMFFKRIHFNFRYTQYPGVDHTYAQFFVIAVRNFKGNHTRFESFFSQIYELDVKQNPTGAFYPFYYGWNTEDIKCHEDPLDDDFKPYAGANAKLKLWQNPDFERCLLDKSKDNLRWYTCPPGPIRMNDSDVPTVLKEWTNMREKYELKGDSSVDAASYGDNAQFCPDGGTWDWTAGELEWALPTGIEVVKDENSLDLNQIVEAEKPSVDGFECEESASTFICKKDTISDKPICTDYHASSCSHNDFKVSGTTPTFGKDPVSGEYQCKKTTFTEKIDALGYKWGNRRVLKLHGKLMIFTWTVAWNVIAFAARFMKEYSVIEKKSSCFGIGSWLWHHMTWTYIAWSSMFAGVYLMAHHYDSYRASVGMGNDELTDGPHDLCNLHFNITQTKTCLGKKDLHNVLGVAACFFFFLSYASGWGRPLNRLLRIALICYHLGMAWTGKILFFVIIYFGYDRSFINHETFVRVIMIEVASVIMFILATIYNCFMDRKFAVSGRRWCPVPEGIDTYEFSPRMQLIISLILPVHIVIQLIFFYVILGSFDDELGKCKNL